MASWFKRTRNGRKVGKWIIKYKAADGRWVMEAGYADLSATKEKAKRLESDVEKVLGGRVDEFEAPRKVSLTEHVAAYERHLTDKGNSIDHIKPTLARINAICTHCDFDSIAKLHAHDATDKVAAYLRGRCTGETCEKGEPKISANTRNHYQTALKGFVRWAVDQKRMPHAPLERLRKISTDNDKPVERRAATADELRKLIAATEQGEPIYGLTGRQRAMLYVVAVNTGLRAKELGKLCPVHFCLDANPPFVDVRASISKNGKAAQQPLPVGVAHQLRSFLSERRDERIWTGTWYRRAKRMLARDLKAAKVAQKTTDGVLDFHSLRVTYITNLVRSGVHPKTCQTLARHSTMDLTMKVYTKLGAAENAEALKGLPDLTPYMHQTGVPLSPKRSQRVQKGGRTKKQKTAQK